MPDHRAPLTEITNTIGARSSTHASTQKRKSSALDVPETDADSTHDLWDTVRLTGKRRRLLQRVPDCQCLAMPRSATDASSTRSGRRYGTDSATSTTTQRAALRPQRHQPFTEGVLIPRGITINKERIISLPPSRHFARHPACSSYRGAGFGADDVALWLDIDTAKSEQIAAEYQFMESKRLPEAEFATFATDMFLRGQPRANNAPTDRAWRAERMMQLVCPPDPAAHWCKPPVCETNERGVADSNIEDNYPWDLRPDCAYWLSMRGFNEDYQHVVGGVCYVYQEWVTCPYLTVEFKRDDCELDVAQVQCCAAGSLALYNRVELFRRARKEMSTSVEAAGGPEEEGSATDGMSAGAGPSTEAGGITQDGDAAPLVHYGMTLTGPVFKIWQLRPRTPPAQGWNGCEMRMLDQGNCGKPNHVMRLAQWVNEIHRWGLTVHALSCERDIKLVLRREANVDVSEIR